MRRQAMAEQRPRGKVVTKDEIIGKLTARVQALEAECADLQRREDSFKAQIRSLNRSLDDMSDARDLASARESLLKQEVERLNARLLPRPVHDDVEGMTREQVQAELKELGVDCTEAVAKVKDALAAKERREEQAAVRDLSLIDLDTN